MNMHVAKRRRRGAALILVLIALAIGLLMVATFLDGRRESVPVADRISAASMARRTAESGLDLAVASLVRSEDWRAALANGEFDGSFEIADGTCKVRIADADTNQAPEDSTLRLLVACTADIDGLSMIAEQMIVVAPAEQPLDVAFGETALIAAHRVRIRNDAALLSWAPRALNTGFNAPLVVGTLDGDVSGFELGDAAVTSGLEILVADARRFGSEATLPGARVLPGSLPKLNAPRIPQVRNGRIESDLEIDSAPLEDIDAESLRIGSNARITIDEDRILHSRGDFRIEPGARIEVTRGTLVIDGDGYVTIHRASITAAPGAQVLIRGGKSLRITDSTIGPEGATEEALSIDGMLPTETDTTAALMTADRDATIMIDGDSMVTGVFIAPEAEVWVMGDALIHGRIMAARIDLGDRCIVFAMPDDGRVVGLTSQFGPHRTADGELVPLVRHPGRLSPNIVLRIANELGVSAIALDEATAPLEADDDSGRRRWNHPRRLRNHRRWRLTRGGD
ncbi:MAG: hypothetical protein OSA40_04015 [Phycisphaerales bacterium]|nr:hypothetical protein [Phycisphaerales bacterium]